MNRKQFCLISLIIILSLIAGSAGVLAQGPQPPRPVVPPAGVSPYRSPGYIQPGERPARLLPRSIDQANAPSVELGQPGTAYRYIKTYGEELTPFISDTIHLDHPYSSFIDDTNNLYVSDDSKRVLGYNSSGQNFFAIGKAGFQSTSDRDLWGPRAVYKDTNGYLWVVDYCRVVQYDSNGTLQQSIPATDNNPWECGSDNDRLSDAVGITIKDNLLFIADLGNHRVQVFTFTETNPPTFVNTIGATGDSGSDNTHFNFPGDIVTDNLGRLYVLDQGNQRIQRCESPNNWTTWSCSTFRSGITDAQGMGIDTDDNIYFTGETNSQIVKKEPTGDETVVVNGGYVYAKDVSVDSLGNIYVTDWPVDVIRKFNSSGQFISNFIGIENIPYLTQSPQLNGPGGITIQSDGSLIVGEIFGYRVVKMNSAGDIIWTAGTTGTWGSPFGDFWGGLEGNPAVTGNGEVLVPDSARHLIHRLNELDGNYINSFGGYGQSNTTFDQPWGVAINPLNGDIFVVDRGNHRIQVFTNAWVYKTTLGLSSVPGSDNQHFSSPMGVAIGVDGKVFVADRDNLRIQKCQTSNGINYTCTTFAGVTGEGGDDFSHIDPVSVAVDSQGRVFVSDWTSGRIEVFDPEGAYLTTIGGTWGFGSSNFRWVVGVAVDTKDNLYISDEINHRVQKYAPGVPGWRQTNINGFGERWNEGVPSLEVFNGQLYAGTAHWGIGGQVWRSSDGASWTMVSEPGFSDTYTNTNAAVIDLIEFNGQLYAGTGWTGHPAQIWRSSNGTSWAPVETGGFGDENNTWISTFTVFGGWLYAGVGNLTDGFEIWRSETGNPNPDSWESSATDGIEYSSNFQVTAFAEFNGDLYIATENSDNTQAARIWSSSDGAIWSEVTTDGFGVPANRFSGGIAVFDGNLYVSFWNETTGTQIFRSGDGAVWVPVVEDGFGDNYNYGTHTLYVYKDQLYAVTWNGVTGMEVWRTSDGSNWGQANPDGFGDSNNQGSIFNRAIVTFKDLLHIGTWNYANGGEVWQLLKPLYLPMLKR